MYFRKIKKIGFLSILFLFTINLILEAHAPDQSYLYFRIYKDAISGRFELSAKDINTAIGTHLDEELKIESVSPHFQEIQNYLKSRSRISSNGTTYQVKFTEPSILNLEEELDFVRFNFELGGLEEVPSALDIDYNVLFDKDTKHRGLLIVEYNFKAGIIDNEAMMSNIFSPSKTSDQLSLTDTSLLKGFKALVGLGVWHIWIGLDHILFILALILPAVVRRRQNAEANLVWQPVDKFKPAFLYILKIITFFTIAHSITLGLASLNFINLNSRFVESIIAISIALASLHNIVPIFKAKEWIIAFGFGLFHGFGFASVLGDKGMGGDFLVPALLGFNVGVEIGQVLIICMIFPVLFLIRKLKLYPFLLKFGSAILIIISLYWFIERGFDIDLQAGAYFWKGYNALFA